ncbi:MAG: TRAP transporter small permease [Methylomonas lenta]|nr:TRAP transporter small permease [Methylomonas lenta]
MSILVKLHQFLLKAENLLLVTIVLSLIMIAVAQILMRNVMGGGLLWADAYTRISVLWIAMLGAMLASRQRNHIAIDIVVQRLPTRWRGLAQRISNGLTGLVCFVAAWFSSDFLLQEFAYADKAFADVPNWLCEAIIPFAFIVIALRYSIAALIGDNHSA